jgi:hypothetical protein
MCASQVQHASGFCRIAALLSLSPGPVAHRLWMSAHVERLEVRNRFLEAELVRLERELTNKAKDAIVARQQAAKRRDRNSPDRPATKALMQLSL